MALETTDKVTPTPQEKQQINAAKIDSEADTPQSRFNATFLCLRLHFKRF